MKKLILIFALATQATLLVARDNDIPYMTKSLSGTSVNSVEVKTSGGSISVTGVAASEAKVEVYVNPQNNNKNYSKEEIQKLLDEKYDLTVTVSNNKVTAIAKNKANFTDWNKALSISFKVYVPVNVSADLSTSGGSINLNNLNGNLEFATSGGSLNVENVGGKVNGRTSGGSIHVSNAKNDIDLTTSGGSIEAKNCEGSLKLSTSGGSLNLSNLNGEIKASTSGGSVSGNNIQGTLNASTSGGSIHLSDLACSLETSTSGGNIEVAITTPGKFIKIGNSAGNIHLSLPKDKGYDFDLAANKISTESIANFSGSIDDKRISGKLNGGGIPVSIKAGSGKIYLDLK